MIDRNHPAVKAMIGHRLHISDASDVAVDRLNDALQLIGPDDLRDTPAGRELMAETWQEGAMAHAEATSHLTPGTRHIINETMRAANPYKEAPDE